MVFDNALYKNVRNPLLVGCCGKRAVDHALLSTPSATESYTQTGARMVCGEDGSDIP